MNNVCVAGRLTADPECRTTENGTIITSFSLAIPRRYTKDGEQEVDFIRCIAFGKTAEFVTKFFIKGMKADITGRIQTGSYTDKKKITRYTTDIIIEGIEFGEKKQEREEETRKGRY